VKLRPLLRFENISTTVLLLAGLIVFILWASFFELDQTVRAQGQIIPSARTQIIQAADGGVLSAILVHEGQSVVAGQVLAVFEKERSSAAFEESRYKVAALEVAMVRAQAEATGRQLKFGTNLVEFPQFISVQRAMYLQRKDALNEELGSLQESLHLAREELRMNESLFQTGDSSHLDVLHAQRQVSELQGKISATRNKYLQDARQEASKLEEELASSRYKLEERKNILDHTELTAPVAGIVKFLKINTIGGVLRPGDELMQISPTEGGLVVEMRVSPSDIGQVQLGLPATIRFDAFDYSIYGTMAGSLSYIGSDTLTESGPDGKATTYYRAHVRLDEEKIKANRKLANVELKPGMTATVDIRTDSRSVLQYLAKPIVKAFSGAMHER
jgi:adhesin transport system membrane fusion protein